MISRFLLLYILISSIKLQAQVITDDWKQEFQNYLVASVNFHQLDNEEAGLISMKKRKLAKQDFKRATGEFLKSTIDNQTILEFVDTLEALDTAMKYFLRPFCFELIAHLKNSSLDEELQQGKQNLLEIVEDENGVLWEYRSVLKSSEIINYFQKTLKPEIKHKDTTHIITIDKSRWATFAKFLEMTIVREHSFEWKSANDTSYQVGALDVKFQSTLNTILYRFGYFQEIRNTFEVYRRKVSGFGGPWESVGDKVLETTKIVFSLGWDGKLSGIHESEIATQWPGQDTPDQIVSGGDGYFYLTKMINKEVQNQFIVDGVEVIRQPSETAPIQVLTESVDDLLSVVENVEFNEDKCESFNQQQVCRMIVDVWHSRPLIIRSRNYFQKVFRRYVTFRKPYLGGYWQEVGKVKRTRDELLFSASYQFKHQSLALAMQ